MDGRENSTWKRRWEEALDRSFKRVDGELAGEFGEGGPIAPEIIGSTAVVVLLSRCQIVVSNCGDSRAVLCRGGQAIPLTSDHKVCGYCGRFFSLHLRYYRNASKKNLDRILSQANTFRSCLSPWCLRSYKF